LTREDNYWLLEHKKLLFLSFGLRYHNDVKNNPVRITFKQLFHHYFTERVLNMKKTSIFVALLATVMIGTASSVAAYNRAEPLPVEAKYSAEIVIDGKKDDGYGPLYAVEQEGAAHTVGLDLTTGQVALAWNDTHIYYYCEVYDQGTPYAVSTTDWQNDGPEFFMDLGNKQSGSYDETSFRVRVIAAYDSPDSIWTEQNLTFNGQNMNGPADVNCASVNDFELAIIPLNGTDWADGYAVELAYDYSAYIDPIVNDQKMGWDVQIVDDVIGLGNRDSQAFLGDPGDVAWIGPAKFGSEITFIGRPADLAAAESQKQEVVYTPANQEPDATRLPVEAKYANVTVDGKMDEGYGPMVAVEQQGVAHTTGLELTTGKVALAWDESNIYYYCEVYDKGTPYAVSGTDWQTDGPEFFMDLMNDKTGSYNNSCFRVRVVAAYDSEGSVWTEQNLTFNGQGKTGPAPVSMAAKEDFDLAIVPLNGTDWADGYAVELSYNYAKYIDPIVEGQIMGWEVQICDDVTGLGSRDSQAFLGNPNDVAHNNPSGFGSEITFTGAAAPETEAPAETAAPETAAPETAAPETAAPETEAPETEAPAETAAPETAAPEVVTPAETAPQTFDAGIIAAAAAIVSAAGYAISKKRR